MIFNNQLKIWKSTISFVLPTKLAYLWTQSLIKFLPKLTWIFITQRRQAARCWKD